MFPTPPDIDRQARLHQLARVEALRLRRQAMDDAWRSAAGWVQRVVRKALGE